MSAIPPRVRWAVDIIAPAGDDHRLELGCGPGAAAALVCARLTTGHLLAVDRSPVAVARTRERNAASVAAGRLTVRQSTIAGLLTPRATDPLPAPEPRVAGPRSADPRATDPRLASPSPARDPSPTPVDTVFAVNVNVFWTTDAVQELSVLHQLLRPGGELFVLYGAAPTGSRSATPVVAAALAANGFGDLTILRNHFRLRSPGHPNTVTCAFLGQKKTAEGARTDRGAGIRAPTGKRRNRCAAMFPLVATAPGESAQPVMISSTSTLYSGQFRTSRNHFRR